MPIIDNAAKTPKTILNFPPISSLVVDTKDLVAALNLS